jgi:hypothetical protein
MWHFLLLVLGWLAIIVCAAIDTLLVWCIFIQIKQIVRIGRRRSQKKHLKLVE